MGLRAGVETFQATGGENATGQVVGFACSVLRDAVSPGGTLVPARTDPNTRSPAPAELAIAWRSCHRHCRLLVVYRNRHYARRRTEACQSPPRRVCACAVAESLPHATGSEKSQRSPGRRATLFWSTTWAAGWREKGRSGTRASASVPFLTPPATPAAPTQRVAIQRGRLCVSAVQMVGGAGL